MNAQQYADLKWLVNQKQYQTSFKQLVDEEVKSLKDTITVCEDGNLKILKERISSCMLMTDFIEQRLGAYEEGIEQKEIKK